MDSKTAKTEVDIAFSHNVPTQLTPSHNDGIAFNLAAALGYGRRVGVALSAS